MGYFQVRYDSRVVNYDRIGFIRLATAAVQWSFPRNGDCSLIRSYELSWVMRNKVSAEQSKNIFHLPRRRRCRRRRRCVSCSFFFIFIFIFSFFLLFLMFNLVFCSRFAPADSRGAVCYCDFMSAVMPCNPVLWNCILLRYANAKVGCANQIGSVSSWRDKVVYKFVQNEAAESKPVKQGHAWPMPLKWQYPLGGIK